MDEEDEYGIPYDYYSPERSFLNHPPSFFDGSREDTLDDSQHHSFGECMRPTLVYFWAKLYATNRAM
jgi:hypothetical protein